MDKKSIAGIVACFVLLLVWYPLMNRIGWMPQPEQKPGYELPLEAERPGHAPDVSGEPAAGGEDKAPVPQVRRDVPPAGSQADLPPDVKLVDAKAMTVVVSPAAGGVAQVALAAYTGSDRVSPVLLGNDRDFPFLSVVNRAQGSEFGPARILDQGPGTLQVQRLAGHDRQLEVSERWSLDPANPYQIRYALTFRNLGATPLSLADYGLLCGSMAAEPGTGGSRLSGAGATELAVDVAEAGQARPESLDVSKIEKLKDRDLAEMAGQQARWLAVHSKYFVLSVSPVSGDFSGYTVEKASGEENEDWVRATAYLPRQMVGAGETAEFAFSAYAGPKEYKRLQAWGQGLERIMRLDLFFFFRPAWMGALSSSLLRMLIWLNGVFDHRWGYGLAIVVLTVLIKTLFWPLTHKSTVSMRRMQKLQPLLQELKEKYRDQPQKLQQKTMELYREHKVNPLGGCLPIVFQIPVFFGLFNTLRGAIELRQASFLWVADLSLPDTLSFQPLGIPIRPLAILMGLSMIVQQHMTPASPDPNQKRMMTFMSLFFIVIFYGMPAGLTLYWTVNQVLTIVQSVISRRLEKIGVVTAK